MTYVTWPSTVNCKFYEEKNALKDNYVTIDNLSGRSVAYKVNQRFISQKSVKLSLTFTEYAEFMTWYRNTLGGCTGVFVCSSLSGYWRFISDLEDERSGPHHTLSIEIEEVL